MLLKDKETWELEPYEFWELEENLVKVRHLIKDANIPKDLKEMVDTHFNFVIIYGMTIVKNRKISEELKNYHAIKEEVRKQIELENQSIRNEVEDKKGFFDMLEDSKPQVS